MSKPKVFVTRVIPDKGLDLVKDFCDVDLWEGELPPSRTELMQRVQQLCLKARSKPPLKGKVGGFKPCGLP